jgi:hypothetical protein
VADLFAVDFFCGFFFATARLAASFLGTFFFAGLAFFAAVFFVLFLRRFSAAIIEKVYHLPEKPSRLTLLIPDLTYQG